MTIPFALPSRSLSVEIFKHNPQRRAHEQTNKYKPSGTIDRNGGSSDNRIPGWFQRRETISTAGEMKFEVTGSPPTRSQKPHRNFSRGFPRKRRRDAAVNRGRTPRGKVRRNNSAKASGSRYAPRPTGTEIQVGRGGERAREDLEFRAKPTN